MTTPYVTTRKGGRLIATRNGRRVGSGETAEELRGNVADRDMKAARSLGSGPGDLAKACTLGVDTLAKASAAG